MWSSAVVSMPPVPQAGSRMLMTCPAPVSVSVVRGDQQVDHQLDDLARGEVLTGGLVGVLGELPDQVLEDVAHLVVRQLVQVPHRGELPTTW